MSTLVPLLAKSTESLPQVGVIENNTTLSITRNALMLLQHAVLLGSSVGFPAILLQHAVLLGSSVGFPAILLQHVVLLGSSIGFPVIMIPIV